MRVLCAVNVAKGSVMNKLIPHKGEPQPITMERLEKCLKIAAKVVVIHGEKYLPIFERIQKEIEIRKEKDKVLDMVKSIANDN